MVQKVSLDAIFTALTCLSSTDYAFKPIYINSQLPVTANNFSMDCQLQAFELLNGNALEKLANILPKSCENQPTGLQQIKLDLTSESFTVSCDQTIFGGNWLMVAQRFDDTTDFYRTWQDYKIGFGNLESEFFLGLDKLHAITSSGLQELLIIMGKRDKEERFAHYDKFGIGNELEKYKINFLGKFNGTAGDALRYHEGAKFSTYDQDNDESPQSCARLHSGAWWYKNCMKSNLFGTFQRFGEPDVPDFKGILWKGFLDGPMGSLKNIKIFVRPHNSL